jgi:ribosome biogenesis GTPase A
MANYWKLVESVIERSDIILEVLDARLPDETRNSLLEEKVKKKGKKILFVMNKCDLADKDRLEETRKRIKPSIFISSRDHLGTTMLRNKIISMSKSDKITVGVCGYPNTGKSSLINALSGRGKTRTSPESGFTKAIQLASAGRIMLIDTPGVIPHDDKDEALLALIGARDASRLRDPEGAALMLIELKKRGIAEKHSIEEKEGYLMLDDYALKTGRLLKGGEPDTQAAARTLIREWQTGKLRV